MKSQLFNKEYIYPKIWNEEDICKFKIYLKTAKELYDMPENLIEMCVERQINEEKGLLEPIDHSKITKIEIDNPKYEEINTVIIQEA